MKKTVPHGYYTCNELGQFHSFDDEPAIVIDTHIEIDENEQEIEISGYQARYNNGILHREDGPAVIRNSGEEFYYVDGNVCEL